MSTVRPQSNSGRSASITPINQSNTNDSNNRSSSNSNSSSSVGGDIFDKLLNLEDEVYQDAKLSGERDAMNENRSDEGFCTGFARGFAVGLEVSFYEEALKLLASEESSSSPSSSSPSPPPINRYKSSMQKLIATINNENDLDRDINSDLATLRSLYKLLNEPSGRFFFISDTKGSTTNDW
jgi:hypothetical protein